MSGFLPLPTGTPAAGDVPVVAADGSTQTAWGAGGGGGGGDVDSVFGRTGTVTAESGDYTVSEVTGAAPLASPAFTGSPTAPTASSGDDSTKLATTAFVATAVGGGGAVSSVFGRTGAVVAESGDYTAAGVGALAEPSGGTYPGGTTTFLRADQTWATPPGTVTDYDGGSAAGGALAVLNFDAGTATSGPPESRHRRGRFLMGVVVQWRRDTAANWTAADSVLYDGEAGLEVDTGQFKLGDGSTAWTSLGYYTDSTALPKAGGVVGELSPTITALTYASTVELNAALGNVFTLTMTGACELANPTGGTDGQVIRVRVTTNGYTLSYGTAYLFGSSGTPSLSSSGLNIAAFEYVAALTGWCFLGATAGLTS